MTILCFRVRLGVGESVFCRIALWDCFENAIASFIGCYKFAQETGAKFAPKTALRSSSLGDLWARIGE